MTRMMMANFPKMKLKVVCKELSNAPTRTKTDSRPKRRSKRWFRPTKGRAAVVRDVTVTAEAPENLDLDLDLDLDLEDRGEDSVVLAALLALRCF